MKTLDDLRVIELMNLEDALVDGLPDDEQFDDTSHPGTMIVLDGIRRREAVLDRQRRAQHR